ncbi:hypothetical protein QBC34DRAFT_411988 [Podospora aff. communis PSN243]|uniref:C2H2-type domain-containing protein n=1 Tax=Podospora aff. communis PSN243 TaxID=3040156 RepID=A0AAV9GFH1_9PEZI|nr:hypothetical protein QBC34DRAFT_411988 [Podospora aff. communis PSN243]
MKTKADIDIERSPASSANSYEFLDVDDFQEGAGNAAGRGSLRDSRRTDHQIKRDRICSLTHPRRIADHLPSAQASPAWHNLHDWSTAASPCRGVSNLAQQATDSDGESPVIVTSGGRKCPFFDQDPYNHVRCARVDLSPDHSLTDHLFDHHLHLPVCWRCGAMFKYVTQRNSHVVSGQCELVNPVPTFEGVSEGTIYELQALVSLWDRTNVQMSDEEKYAKIWQLVFPRENLHVVSSARERGKRRDDQAI